ncbi:MAG: tRNA 2-thiocytidine(32) synthetase TtcA [Syntrophaceae bacterium]|nr:tRNA 2-thiocytidine(32) synthetase TtcA [Syntrophaceae bacterium]
MRQKLTRLVGKAIGDFDLINQDDRILVALSGGKDSWSLLLALKELQRKAPINYTLGAVTIHPGSGIFNTEPLVERLQQEGISHEVIHGNLTQIVNNNLTDGTNPCSFCSRLRRGVLYSYAYQNRWNKIAIGHHADDFIETLLLNLFFNGLIKGMSPKLLSDDGRNIVIRPLVYVSEDLTSKFALENSLPIVGCSCPYMGMANRRRDWVKNLISKIEMEAPNVKSSMLSAMGRVRSRHLWDLSKYDHSCKKDSLRQET